MNKQEMFALINANPGFHLATVEGDQPRCRGMFLKPWRESGELKDFYNQFKVYCLKGGKAVAWTMATNFAPKEIVEL